MGFEVGCSYIIVFDVGGRALSFNCDIISEDDNYVTFKDKFGRILSYNKKTIISFEEVGEGKE